VRIEVKNLHWIKLYIRENYLAPWHKLLISEAQMYDRRQNIKGSFRLTKSYVGNTEKGGG